MTDQQLEDRLRAWFRPLVDEAPPATLRRSVAAIPDRIPVPVGWRELFRSRPILVLAAAAAAAAVIGVLAVAGALYFSRPLTGEVGGPSPTPGGSSSPSQTASPSTGPSPSAVPARPATWTATGNMITPRYFATAVLLRNGKVLVFGGFGSSDPCCKQLASAELYDPATGIWTATGSMVGGPGGLYSTTTLLRDGRVLVTGGGWGNDRAAQLYDPANGTWTATGNMITPRGDETATLLPDGKVLVAGGQWGAKELTLDSAELYDPSTGTWAATGRMLVPGGGAAALLRNGKVLVAGGYDPAIGALSAAELYDPASGTWTTTGSMVTTSGSYGATLLPDGRVLVVGDGREGPSVEVYDPQSGSWSPPPAGTWTHGGPWLPNGNDNLIVLLDGRLLLLGVSGSPATETYDPSSGTWTETAGMSRQTEGYTATLLPDGRVLVAGGYVAALSVGDLLNPSSIVASAELYDPGSP